MKKHSKRATPLVSSYINDQAEYTDLPPDGVEESEVTDTESLENSDIESEADDTLDDTSDDNWLDELTPYVTQTQTTSSTTPQGVSNNKDQTQMERLATAWDNLEHLDEDVAKEVHDKILSPELASIQATIREIKEQQKREQELKQAQILGATNEKILKQHPNAGRIMESREFAEFVNAKSNPYAADTEFNNLTRAYYAGDADYVVKALDEFVKSRGKPKPKVSLENSKGGGQSVVGEAKQRKKPMTAEEYMVRRNQIRSAPRGSLPENALQTLANEYYGKRG